MIQKSYRQARIIPGQVGHTGCPLWNGHLSSFYFRIKNMSAGHLLLLWKRINDHYGAELFIIETMNEVMRRCLELAEQARQLNENPVGAVLTDDNGDVIAEAMESNRSKNDITCHAEIEVIRIALRKLETNQLPGTTLYTTHEPCIMCSYVIRHYGIRKVVYAHRSERGGINSLFPVLTTDQIPGWEPPPEILEFKV